MNEAGSNSTFDSMACKKHALNIRKHIINMLHAAGSGHPGGSLSSADILSVLYFGGILRFDKQHMSNEMRDRFILSKGHAAPVLYATLAELGLIDCAQLTSLRSLKSSLQGHPDMHKCPGVEVSTGSLGQGLSIGCGMALGLKKEFQEKAPAVFVLTGDGELQEGSNWEALMFAAHYKLNNLVMIVDNNNLQIDGHVDEVMNINPLDEKLKAFGLKVFTCDGHDVTQLYNTLLLARQYNEAPCAVICKTVKGKGVSFMENQASWHGKAPNEEQKQQALKELEDQEV